MAIFHKTLQYHEDTTEKRDISQEDIEFLKKLQLEMNTQDTTGTADPRFWVIKGSERVINNEDPDELCLQVDGSTVTSTTEETVKYLNDNILPDCNIDRGCKIETGYTWDFKLTYTEDGEEEYDDLSTQEVNEFLANNGHDDTMIIGISIRPFMYPNTMFLTEKEAREHLKRNYYHYSEDAHTYCMVAWRSPEVEKLWKILRETKWDCKDKELESHEEKYILHYCIRTPSGNRWGDRKEYMKTICFTVPGKPQGKARARTFYNPKTQGMSSVTPEKTVLYENFISTCYLQIAGEERFEDTAYIRIRIQAFFEVPKSSSKVKKEAMLNGEILPAKKPDIDNIAKAVLDALNSVAYRDDTQVVELQLRKQYSEKPRVEICMEELEV